MFPSESSGPRELQETELGVEIIVGIWGCSGGVGTVSPGNPCLWSSPVHTSNQSHIHEIHSVCCC